MLISHYTKSCFCMLAKVLQLQDYL